jgi:hypothetical protein
MNSLLHIPFELLGVRNEIEVIYKANESAIESGFDTLADLPFDPNLCIGYPTVHAYVKEMKSTGYRRRCAIIQLVKREYFSSDTLTQPDEVNISVDSLTGVIYQAIGDPAEIYDAPCNNLNGNVKGTWTAYTYFVDVPSRINGWVLSFLAGFQWGYKEALIDGKLTVQMLDIKEVDITQWREHIPCMKAEYPQHNYST